MIEGNIDIMHFCPRTLSEEQQETIDTVKHFGNKLYSLIDRLGECREFSLAKTKLEGAVMWAVKGIS